MSRQASDEYGKAIGVLADLQGPKIRLGRFAAGPVGLGGGRGCLPRNEWAARMWEPSVGKERSNAQYWEGEI
jgi:pyruvate kinase